VDLSRPLSLITPSLDGDVLALLAAGHVKLSGREISRRIGASQEGVRRVLERLVADGIVLLERAGAAHLYQLNREHLAASAIEHLTGMRTELLDRLRRAIDAWTIAPAAAVLFGSVARGDAKPSSDIDLLVVRPRAVDGDNLEWRRQLTDLVVCTKAMTGNDTRIVEYSYDDARALGRNERVLAAAAHDGIPLSGSLRAFITDSRKKGTRR